MESLALQHRWDSGTGKQRGGGGRSPTACKGGVLSRFLQPRPWVLGPAGVPGPCFLLTAWLLKWLDKPSLTSLTLSFSSLLTCRRKRGGESGGDYLVKPVVKPGRKPDLSREALRCTRNVPHRGCGGACGGGGFHLPGPPEPLTPEAMRLLHRQVLGAGVLGREAVEPGASSSGRFSLGSLRFLPAPIS